MKLSYIRRFFYEIHLWLGIISGIVVFIVCLSGGIYAFREEVMMLCESQKYFVKVPASQSGVLPERISADDLVKKLEAENPGQKVSSIRIPDKANRTITVRLTQSRNNSGFGAGGNAGGFRRGQNRNENPDESRRRQNPIENVENNNETKNEKVAVENVEKNNETKETKTEQTPAENVDNKSEPKTEQVAAESNQGNNEIRRERNRGEGRTNVAGQGTERPRQGNPQNAGGGGGGPGGRGGNEIFVDPYTGNVVGKGTSETSQAWNKFFGSVMQLHRNLWIDHYLRGSNNRGGQPPMGNNTGERNNIAQRQTENSGNDRNLSEGENRNERRGRGEGFAGGERRERRGRGGEGFTDGERRGRGGEGFTDGERRGRGGEGFADGERGERRGRGGEGFADGERRGRGGEGFADGERRGRGGESFADGERRGRGGEGAAAAGGERGERAGGRGEGAARGGAGGAMGGGRRTSVGQMVVGIATLIFIVVLISGFVLWLPRKLSGFRSWKVWRAGLKVRVTKGIWPFIHDLHNTVGFYIFIPILILALTGLCWSFSWYRDAASWVLGDEIFKQRRMRGNTAVIEPVDEQMQPLSIEEIIKRTEGYIPGKGEVIVTIPNNRNGVMLVQKGSTGFFALSIKDSVQWDRFRGKLVPFKIPVGYAGARTQNPPNQNPSSPNTANNPPDNTSNNNNNVAGAGGGVKIIEVDVNRFSDKKLGEKIAMSIRSLHFGEVTGLSSKLLFGASCFLACSFPITGILLWIKKLRTIHKKPKKT
jgi:uncharacterized iron-regulated membrane protein